MTDHAYPQGLTEMEQTASWIWIHVEIYGCYLSDVLSYGKSESIYNQLKHCKYYFYEMCSDENITFKRYIIIDAYVSTRSIYFALLLKHFDSDIPNRIAIHNQYNLYHIFLSFAQSPQSASTQHRMVAWNRNICAFFVTLWCTRGPIFSPFCR